MDFDVTIIGGGIVGLATAYKITLRFPHLRVVVLEKERTLASHQTGRNSGVIHSGLYYKPGSAKARTCTVGRRELVQFAKAHHVPCEICGKVIVATHEQELAQLERIYKNGLQNDVEGIEIVTPARIKELEPQCSGGLAGLHVPCTGIIDYVRIAHTLADLIRMRAGNQVLTGHEVRRLDRRNSHTEVDTGPRNFKTRFFINCGGLQSDRIARLDGVDTDMRIVPFRGDYFELSTEAAVKVRNLIYPVPDTRFPFLGVHFTRTIHGVTECGPNAVFSFKREGYSKTAFNLRDTWQALTFPGTWKLFIRNWKYGAAEYARAFSKGLFLRQLQRLIPSLGPRDLRPGACGIRAQAVGLDGRPIDDFVIRTQRNGIHVLNAPSPAATACLAIGEHISFLAGESLGWDKVQS